MDAKEYIKGLKSGDRKVLESLYNTNLKTVISWIRKNGGSEDDGLDIFQDSLEAVIRKAYKNELKINSSFDAFLFRVCRNKWIDKIRKRKLDEKVRIVELDRYDNETGIEEIVEEVNHEQQLRHMLDGTFQKLSPLCQKLLKLVESNATTDEIVAQMEMNSSNTMYRRKFACMKSWKGHIEKHPFYGIWKSES